jgi:hypothetical protein
MITHSKLMALFILIKDTFRLLSCSDIHEWKDSKCLLYQKCLTRLQWKSPQNRPINCVKLYTGRFHCCDQYYYSKYLVIASFIRCILLHFEASHTLGSKLKSSSVCWSRHRFTTALVAVTFRAHIKFPISAMSCIIPTCMTILHNGFTITWALTFINCW